MNKKNTKTMVLASWLFVLLGAAVSIFLLTSKQSFSGILGYVMLGLIAIIALGMLLLTLASGKKPVAIINIVVALGLAIVGVVSPNNAKNKLSLTEPSRVGVRNINFYVLNEEYRTAHESEFSFTKPSQSVTDYASRTYILQTELNTSDQDSAMTDLASVVGSEYKTVTYATVQEAIDAFYNNEGDVLVLNEAIVEQLTSNDAYSSFTNDTFVLYTASIGEDTSSVEEPTDTDGAQPFVVYVAGNDTRDDALTLYGRTDVDMIMAINPNNKQILMISLPRDFYVQNPALDNGYDKLTHLGNDGIQNTLDGVNQLFGLEITNYLTTNFTHFVSLVDSIGGIDIYNPYAFEGQNSGNYDFAEGDLHLNGEQALAYARERYSLSNGDYGRNAHQGIAMQGILTKVQQMTEDGQYADVISALTSNFLTNINVSDIYGLLKGKSEGEWSFIKYHLGGEGTYDGTASMGYDRQLYVCKPFTSQINFATEQINKVLNGEEITEQELPDAGSTTFVEN